ncbi:MAG: hypothetical protein SOW20_05555 [Berryella intestinalis]|uniref:hypothetical protein n=1 Tax=Berryella intestinalis TaxID=1531429 RepID=UPI002A564665|nr:hypothetical protein [Berryella intestinalis]MDD7369684.1 hypothetical protein [Berryella intestinalis]MDY3129472.1 hypothetical protein [Berryella intestinalis]
MGSTKGKGVLFVLTGNIQIGKTRWIERLIRDLDDAGIPAYGVVAPGMWRSIRASASLQGDPGALEKVGIDNVLLPERQRVTFALRRDVAVRCGALDPQSQAERAGLGWSIDDGALARVNAHFSGLSLRPPTVPGLLVVDELGRLELECGEGLVEAVRLLDSGATASFPHALVVVREDLLPRALSRLDAGTWGGVRVVGPDRSGLSRDLRLSFGVRES